MSRNLLLLAAVALLLSALEITPAFSLKVDLVDVGKYGNYFVAVIFFVVGLHLLGVIPAPWSGPGQIGMKRKGLLAALVYELE